MEAILSIWKRDVIKSIRDKASLIGNLALPILLLIIFGSGMGGAIKFMTERAGIGNALSEFNFTKFMFPGVVGITIFSTAVISALTVVQDREFGYLREMLVSPIPRGSISLGKVLGGSTAAVIQGLIILVLSPLIGISLNFTMILKLIPAMLILAFTVSSLSLYVATFVKSSQGFHTALTMLILPMIFLSGSIFPLTGSPAWMEFLVKINPVTYGVDMFKKILLGSQEMPKIVQDVMGLNLSVFGYSFTEYTDFVLVLAIGILLLFLATGRMKKVEA